MEFDHILVAEEVVPVYHLALEFTVSPDTRESKLGDEIVVHQGGEVQQVGAPLQRVGAAEVELLTRGLGVHADQFEQLEDRAAQLFQTLAGLC